MRRSTLLVLATALAFPSLATAQRAVRQVTTLAEAHQDAKISPDGTTIAFRGLSKLSVVPYAGGNELVLVSSAALGEYLWTPTSGGLYFLDGTTVKYVTRTGGSPITIRALPGSQHHLWCLTKNDQTIYGSRYDASTTKYSIFTLATNGQSAPVDIVQSVLTVDAVALDPTNAQMVYREYFGGTPFANREYWLASSGGGGATSLTGGPIAGQLDQPEFVDNGTTIVFTSVATTFQIGTLALGNPTIRYLTDTPGLGRRSSVFADRSWIACEVSNPPAAGGRIALIPASGGGRVLLDLNKPVLLQSNPTSDLTGQRIAFAATEPGVTTVPQIYAIELDRELRISPRVEIAKVSTLELPLGASEVGGIFLAGGLSGTPFTVGGILHAYELDFATTVHVYSGPGTGGALTLPIPVPSDPALVGQVLWWQGVRVSTVTLTGDFTRVVSTRVF